MDQIRYYYKNATSDAIDPKHSVSLAELKKIAPRIRQITNEMTDQRRAGQLPYRDLPYQTEMVDQINKAVEHFRTRCEVLIVLGIGGSALGNIALQNALNPCTYNLQTDRNRSGPQLFILDNVDPDQIRSVVELVTPKIKKTIVNVISKSGETAETAAQFILFRDLLQKHLGKAYKDNILATTDPKGGTLREIATKEGFPTLEVPDGVGGRFSVLSAVGLFSAAMCGIDIDQLLEGAADMDKRVKGGDLFANPSAMIAALHYLLDQRGKKIAVMMPYSTALYSCADWFRQLWAESLGKRDGLKKKNVYAGQTPIKALGTTDQHSQVQLYREGPNDKIITFLEVEKFQRPLSIPDTMKHVETLKYLANSSFQTLINNEKIATEYALIESDRPTATVIFPRISPATVGQFLYLYEVAVSYMGALLDINTYDQPAVQLGKDATYALMGKPGHEKLRTEITPVATKNKKYLL
ncbi:MAG TPA: glucose-6-phosphate isomerase [Tepidisphaeraceae bacterium]|jgi:glucose-6-phosphate isomerase|nr:glucose-6-phosphate isomerase [Tepidisphaeraceae bacterium]